MGQFWNQESDYFSRLIKQKYNFTRNWTGIVTSHFQPRIALFYGVTENRPNAIGINWNREQVNDATHLQN